MIRLYPEHLFSVGSRSVLLPRVQVQLPMPPLSTLTLFRAPRRRWLRKQAPPTSTSTWTPSWTRSRGDCATRRSRWCGRCRRAGRRWRSRAAPWDPWVGRTSIAASAVRVRTGTNYEKWRQKRNNFVRRKRAFSSSPPPRADACWQLCYRNALAGVGKNRRWSSLRCRPRQSSRAAYHLSTSLKRRPNG